MFNKKDTVCFVPGGDDRTKPGHACARGYLLNLAHTAKLKPDVYNEILLNYQYLCDPLLPVLLFNMSVSAFY